VTVIDCVNFRGYEDTSPTAKLQAQYTDLLLLSKHELCTERELDILMDHLGELNDGTPSVRVGPANPLSPSLVFGLDSKLFLQGSAEAASWAAIGGEGAHADEVETRSVWRGGARPGKHTHEEGACETCAQDQDEAQDTAVVPIPRDELEAALASLPAEVYRVKGVVRFPSSEGYQTYVLNWAFGRHTLTLIPALDSVDDLAGVGVRLTVMGERWETRGIARRFAERIGANVA
jgi:G3E family GTPase